MTCLARLLGTAKPTPCDPPDSLKIAVLMPTSSPRALTSAPPELPLVDGGVGLDEVDVGREAALQVAAGRADDAERDRLVEHAERIADRQHPLGDLQLRRIAPGQRRQVAGVDLEHRQVGRLVDADDLRRAARACPASVTETSAPRVADDVAVGEDVAVGRDDDAGAEALLQPVAITERALAAEELGKNGSFRNGEFGVRTTAATRCWARSGSRSARRCGEVGQAGDRAGLRACVRGRGRSRRLAASGCAAASPARAQPAGQDQAADEADEHEQRDERTDV